MKNFFFLFFFLFVGKNLSAQISFVDFDEPVCSSPMTNIYTYTNYSSGTGSGTYGFKVFRNGTQVYDISGSLTTGRTCYNLISINDSTVFVVAECGMCGAYMIKTVNYGNTWVYMGGGPSGYLGAYVVNVNYAYLVTAPNTYELFITRCSDIDPPSWPGFVFDTTLSPDVYRTDTILGNSLCNIDSLNVIIKNNSGDTIDYHINIASAPLGINEHQLTKPIYTIYPNPATDMIQIEGAVFSKAEIYNVQGEKIMESKSKIINIGDLSNGIYFIKIIDLSGQLHNSKFIKE